MSNQCQAIVGYLVPRKSCPNSPQTHCAKCKTPICAEHTEITEAGSLCPQCSRPLAVTIIDPKDEIYFSEADLKQFAEAYRQQKNQHGGWIEFT